MRRLTQNAYAMGEERQFTIVNNQASAADITGLKFNKAGTTGAFVEFLVQRVTTGGGAVELTEIGVFSVIYEPTSNSWTLTEINVNNPDNSGVTFSITSTGQVQYTSTNETGTASISSLFWRARTFAGKNRQFSKFNR